GDPLIEGTLEEITAETPLKIIWLNSSEIIAGELPPARERYHARAGMFVTYPEYLEFIDAGVTKAAGIAAVADEYGIAPAEVLAFGDGDNDVPMFEWAGHSVAMSKSSPAAQAAAKIVAPPGDPATSLARAIRSLL
ncbi:MAG TPA: HAD-IIB family hydrolase, partial [Chthoniobacteraceae bacterium]|nr:HAD-IIB family hydrolase [Chthoniobacteraceae bacterium]